jgi:hypothetical protein
MRSIDQPLLTRLPSSGQAQTSQVPFTMYNAHRGMVPAPNSRLNELLDQLRQEFENQSRSTGEFEHQRKCTFLVFSSHIAAFSRLGVGPEGLCFYQDTFATDSTNAPYRSNRTAPGNGDDSPEGLPA